MKKALFIAILSALALPVYAAPPYTVSKTILPEITNSYELGTTTRQWLNIFSQNASTTNLLVQNVGAVNATTTFLGNVRVNGILQVIDRIIATTLYVVDEVFYNGITGPAFTATSTSVASIFPYASTTSITSSGISQLGGLIIPDQVGGGIVLRDAGNASLNPTQNYILFAHPSAGEDTDFGYESASVFEIDVRSGGTRQLKLHNSDGGNLDVCLADNCDVFVDGDVGNVGVGSTTPQAKLAVGGGNILLENNRYISAYRNGGSVIDILGINGSSQTQLRSGAGNNLIFQPAGSTAMTLTPTGLVGIATTSPDYLLTLGNAAGLANNKIAIDAAGARQASIDFRSDGVDRWFIGRGDSDVLPVTTFFIGNTSGGTNNDPGGASAKFVIDSSANVGIGTSTPQADLNIGNNIAIESASAGSSVPARSTLGGALLGIGLLDTGPYIQSFASQPLLLNPGGNNVGIGTTTPGRALSVQAISPGVNPIALFATSTATNVSPNASSSQFWIDFDGIAKVRDWFGNLAKYTSGAGMWQQTATSSAYSISKESEVDQVLTSYNFKFTEARTNPWVEVSGSIDNSGICPSGDDPTLKVVMTTTSTGQTNANGVHVITRSGSWDVPVAGERIGACQAEDTNSSGTLYCEFDVGRAGLTFNYGASVFLNVVAADFDDTDCIVGLSNLKVFFH